jgi:hypothetical protein
MNNERTLNFRSMLAALFMIVVCGVGPMCGQQPEENLRLKLTNLPAPPRPTAALDAIDARLELATVQSASRGLRITLVLLNTSAEPVSIVNPDDLTSVLILDAEGWPLEVPRGIPRALYDGALPPGQMPEESKPVTIAPGKEYRMPIVITHVLPPAKGDATERKPQPIAPGVYKVKVTATLAGDQPAEGQRPSRTVSTADPFTVHLGV